MASSDRARRTSTVFGLFGDTLLGTSPSVLNAASIDVHVASTLVLNGMESHAAKLTVFGCVVEANLFLKNAPVPAAFVEDVVTAQKANLNLAGATVDIIESVTSAWRTDQESGASKSASPRRGRPTKRGGRGGGGGGSGTDDESDDEGDLPRSATLSASAALTLVLGGTSALQAQSTYRSFSKDARVAVAEAREHIGRQTTLIRRSLTKLNDPLVKAALNEFDQLGAAERLKFSTPVEKAIGVANTSRILMHLVRNQLERGTSSGQREAEARKRLEALTPSGTGKAAVDKYIADFNEKVTGLNDAGATVSGGEMVAIFVNGLRRGSSHCQEVATQVERELSVLRARPSTIKHDSLPDSHPAPVTDMSLQEVQTLASTLYASLIKTTKDTSGADAVPSASTGKKNSGKNRRKSGNKGSASDGPTEIAHSATSARNTPRGGTWKPGADGNRQGKGQGKGKGKGKGQRPAHTELLSHVECYHCGKRGHISTNCPTRNSSSAAQAEGEGVSVDQDGVVELATAVMEKGLENLETRLSDLIVTRVLAAISAKGQGFDS